MALKEKILDKAQKFIQKGYLDKAIAEYRAAFELDPKDTSIRLRIGDLYVKTGRKEEAVKEYMEAAKSNAQRGFYLKAIAVYKQILKLDASNLDVHNKLADLYTKQRLIADAVSEYSFIVSAIERAGKPAEVTELLKKMISVDPENIGVRLKLADHHQKLGFKKDALGEYLWIFDKLVSQGKYDKAEKIFFGLNNVYPNEETVLNKLSESYKSRGEAGQFLKLASTLFDIYTGAGDTEKAKAICQSILEVSPTDAKSLGYMSQFRVGKESDVTVTPEEKEPAPAPPSAGIESALPEVKPEEKPPFASRAHVPASASAPEEEIEISLEGFDEIVEEAPVAPEGIIEGKVFSPEERAGEPEITEVKDKAFEAPAPAMEEAKFTAGQAEDIFEPPQKPADEVFEEIHLEPLGPSEGKEAEFGIDLEVKGSPEVSEEVSKGFETDELARVAESSMPVETEAALASEAKTAEDVTVEADRSEIEEEKTTAEPVFNEADLTLKGARQEEIIKAEDAVIEVVEAAPAEEHRAAPAETIEFQPAPLEPVEAPLEVIEPPVEPLSEVVEPQAARPETFQPEPSSIASQIETSPAEDVEHVKLDAVESEEIQEDLSKAISELMEKIEPEGRGVEAYPRAAETEEGAPEEKEAKEEYVDLSAELGMEETLEKMAGSWGKDEPKETFDEFKNGIGQQLNREDTETHYNLGIAYMEMELHNDAVKEFKIALKDPNLEFDCYTRLGICSMALSNPGEAIANYLKGLRIRGRTDEERRGMMYELALAYESAGKAELAGTLFKSIHDIDPDYREVSKKIKAFIMERPLIPLDDGLIEVELL